MATGKIGPGAGADAAMVYIAENYPKRCGHGKAWEEECQDCNAVWREEQVKTLNKQAAKYGFRLVAECDLYHCNICGGVVDLSNATKPTVHLGTGRKPGRGP